MLKQLFFFCLLWVSFTASSQEFGGIPPSQKWKRIRAPRINVIYPAGLDSSAGKVASIVTAVIHTGDSTIGRNFRKAPIILQNQSTLSNGYVSLAPYRSEFLLTPPLNGFELGNGDWLTTLTLHELRHMQQYSNFNRGWAKVFRVVLGDQGQALANALSVPDWFFEGDAVYQETRLTRQGRGRLPAFYNGFRSIWQSRAGFDYMKLRNGSLKHYVPNHYELGYLLVSHGYYHYGTDFWKKVSEDAAAMKGLLYPFQRAIKKHSGIRFRQFTQQALEERKSALVDSTSITQPSGTYISEENPVFTETGDLLFLKTTFRELPAFILRTPQGDKYIRQRDRSADQYFSYARDKVIYASYRPHPRWGWKDYGELQLLDLATGKQERITKATKYFHPSLSQRADSIVAVHIGPDGHNSIHLLALDGRLMYSIDMPGGLLAAYPKFYQGKILAAVRKSDGSMALWNFGMSGEDPEQLTEWRNQVIAYPVVYKDIIFYAASAGLQDQLVRWDPVSKSSKTMIFPGSGTSRTGKYQPTLFGDSIAYMEFTANGYKVRVADSRKLQLIESTLPESAGLDFLTPPKMGNNLSLSDTAIQISTAESYPRSKGLFHFHSWQPFVEDPEFSFSLLGQNLLNTMQSQLNFLYNRNEKSKQFGFSALYGGWFPYLGGGVDITLDRKARYRDRTINWHELETNIGATIPLNWSRGRQLSFFTAHTNLVYNKPYFSEPEKSQLGDLSWLYLDHQLRYSIQSRQAVQAFHPRYALSLRGQYRHALNRYESWQSLATASIYLPGFVRNHSLVVNLAAHHRDSMQGIRFSDNFPFSRGYESANLFRILKWGVNYQLPLFYPDIGLANILYLLRVRSNFFYDHSYSKDPSLFPGEDRLEFRSAGTELFFDTKWWNQLPVSFGLRYSRLLDPDRFNGAGANRWQFILPLNLVPNPVNRSPKPHF